MTSEIVRDLQPSFSPIAIVWSGAVHNGALKTKLRDDILTLALPLPLFRRVECEARQSILQTPGYLKLRST